MSRKELALLQGTLDVLILRSLSAAPLHGYAVCQWIHDRTDGALSVEDAALYKALHRLEQVGAISASWGASENNRRARYYRLTPKGRRRLRADRSAFERYVTTLLQVLRP
jgi:transcriptional regulator